MPFKSIIFKACSSDFFLGGEDSLLCSFSINIQNLALEIDSILKRTVLNFGGFPFLVYSASVFKIVPSELIPV